MIKLLPEGVWARIAAGEVVERPVSAVKEMAENSMDAGAKRIRVKLWDGGRVRIVVEDDGAGIEFGDLPLALTPHATSKIGKIEDLEAIRTLGYRGEALASLAAVAKMEIRSKTAGGSGGVIRAYEGRVTDHAEANCAPGTRVQADEIFANLPARRKFLKSASGELRRVAALLREYAICRPEIAFALEHDGKPVFSTDGAGTRRRAIEQLWGAEPAVRETEVAAGRVTLECWWQPHPGGRNEIASFVNGRAVYDPLIKGAVSAAARELTGGWALFFSIDPSLVDVNIHPAKAEIRFRYPGDVFDVMKEAAAKLGAGASLGIRMPDESAKAAPYQNTASYRNTDKGGWDFKADLNDLNTKNSFSLNLNTKNSSLNTKDSFSPPVRTSSYSGGVPGRETFQSAFSRVTPPEFGFEPEELSPSDQIPESGGSPYPAEISYFGQLASGYLLFDSPEGLTLVDPHAAHERIEYERIKTAASEGKRSQPLLIPSPVPPTLRLEAEEKAALLEEMGFAFDEAEGGTRMTAAPYLPGLAETSVSPDALLRGSIAALREGGDKEAVTELLWRTWATMACKEAVKVTTRLMPEEAAVLLRDLRGCRQPLFCPHGRPTVLELSAADLRKHFGRE